MPDWVVSLAEILLLVFALSTDAFTASLAYGTQKIRIPWSSIAVISLVCSSVTTASLLLGRAIGPHIPHGLPRWLGFGILLGLGIVKLFDSSIKAYIRRHRELKKRLHFSFSNLQFILTVYADPEKADQDASQTLSATEAASLALALSIDGLAAGFGAGLAENGWYQVFLASFLVSILAVRLGHGAGKLLSRKLTLDLSWLGGTMLILLAFLKLLPG